MPERTKVTTANAHYFKLTFVWQSYYRPLRQNSLWWWWLFTHSLKEKKIKERRAEKRKRNEKGREVANYGKEHEKEKKDKAMAGMSPVPLAIFIKICTQLNPGWPVKMYHKILHCLWHLWISHQNLGGRRKWTQSVVSCINSNARDLLKSVNRDWICLKASGFC